MVGVWWSDQEYRSFWPLVESAGSRALMAYVTARYGGGRILLLPDGKVIKPLQDDDEVGIRVVIGKFDGPIRLWRHDGSILDLSRRGALGAGEPWPGPDGAGVEAKIDEDGSLTCRWYHPTRWGKDTVTAKVIRSNQALAVGYRKSRGRSTGRVNVTPNGLVVACGDDGGDWLPRYVGRIEPTDWPRLNTWIQGMSA
jgi:hypothetical protein